MKHTIIFNTRATVKQEIETDIELDALINGLEGGLYFTSISGKDIVNDGLEVVGKIVDVDFDDIVNEDFDTE